MPQQCGARTETHDSRVDNGNAAIISTAQMLYTRCVQPYSTRCAKSKSNWLDDTRIIKHKVLTLVNWGLPATSGWLKKREMS